MPAPRPLDRPLRDIAAALRDGSLTARTLAEAAIESQRRHEPDLNAYRVRDEGLTLRQAAAADAAFAAGSDLGLLQGVPISAKDLYGVKGYDTFAGSPKALPPAFEAEGPVIAAARRSLAVITGKTHTVEFAFGGIGWNPHWEVPRNPWDATEHRAPGGSSAGAGVSLWEGSALVALGSDTAGSVRIPASWTGSVGVKTSFGRWSLDGITPLSPSLDTAGTLTLSAADAAVAFAVLDPIAAHDPAGFLARCDAVEAADLRIGVADWLFEGCEPGIAEGVEAAIRELEAAGARVRRIALPEIDTVYEVFRAGGLAGIEFAAFINGVLPAWRATLDPFVQARFASVEQAPASEYLDRRRRLAEAAASVKASMAGVDAIVGPTVPISPPRLADCATLEGYMPRNFMALRNTMIGNLLSLCGVTLPVAKDALGLPIGLQLLFPLGEDERAVAAACAVERTLGTPRAVLGTPPRLAA
jgi:aspartyl-tRNA(Asn)/glutamyl-tRNA(Gln) amidotransferase subunit A